ncbi:MAG: hypothetical protein AMXMBFR64_54010 [Myxococcales bacterium]
MKQPPTLLTITVTLLLMGGCANDAECPQGTTRAGGRCTIPGAAEGLFPEVSEGAGDAPQQDTSTDAAPADADAGDGSTAADGAIQEDTGESTTPGDADGGDAGDGEGVGWVPAARRDTRRDATAVAARGDGATRGFVSDAHRTDEDASRGGGGHTRHRTKAAEVHARQVRGAPRGLAGAAGRCTSNRARVTPGELGQMRHPARTLVALPTALRTSSPPVLPLAPALG